MQCKSCNVFFTINVCICIKSCGGLNASTETATASHGAVLDKQSNLNPPLNGIVRANIWGRVQWYSLRNRAPRSANLWTKARNSLHQVAQVSRTHRNWLLTPVKWIQSSCSFLLFTYCFFISMKMLTFYFWLSTIERSGKSTRDSCRIIRNPIVFTIFWLIWNQIIFHLVPNQSENGKYNRVFVWFNKIWKRFLCVFFI